MLDKQRHALAHAYFDDVEVRNGNMICRHESFGNQALEICSDSIEDGLALAVELVADLQLLDPRVDDRWSVEFDMYDYWVAGDEFPRVRRAFDTVRGRIGAWSEDQRLTRLSAARAARLDLLDRSRQGIRSA